MCQNVHFPFKTKQMFSVLIPFAFCFYFWRRQVTLPPEKISKRNCCLLLFLMLKISHTFATLTLLLMEYIGQVILLKAKQTQLVLPNPLQHENCKSSPSSQIPPSDSPVICHMAYSSCCNLSYCGHPTGLSAVSIHPGFCQTLQSP